MNYESYERIKVERAGRILTLSLNRPDHLNAIDDPMHEELARIFHDVQIDEEADVIVLTGAGRAFSAGGDMAWLRELSTGGTLASSVVKTKRMIFSFLDLEKPIIARIPGPCIGLGASLALLCDISYASENARIGDPHVKVGLVAGDGGVVAWPHLVGHARAKEFLMTGDLLTATEAERIGLINHVVPEDELDARVYAMAERLANGATRAIRWTKTSINIGLKRYAHSVMDTCLGYEMLTFASNDHREAVDAFVNKRRPEFKGD